MKSLLLVSVIGTGLLLAQGCAGPPIDSPQPTAPIESFTYGFGSFFGSTAEYRVERTGEQTRFTAKVTEHVKGDEPVEVSTDVDDAVWDDIESIVSTHDLDTWDGHDESDDGVMDGYSFSLDYTRADGTKVAAFEYGGEMRVPGYDAAHEDLTTLFDTLVEKS